MVDAWPSGDSGAALGGGGWIGIERFAHISRASTARTMLNRQPASGDRSDSAVSRSLSRSSAGSSPIASISQKPAQAAQARRIHARGAYKLLANKYYVDEIYGATIVRPLLGVLEISFLNGWSTWQSSAALHGCSAVSHSSQERFCNVGSPAICDRTPRGSRWARLRSCCS